MSSVSKGTEVGSQPGPLPCPFPFRGLWIPVCVSLCGALAGMARAAEKPATKRQAVATPVASDPWDTGASPVKAVPENPVTKRQAVAAQRGSGSRPAISIATKESLKERADRALQDQRYVAAAALYRRAAAMAIATDPWDADVPQMKAVATFLEQYGRTRRDLARAMSRDDVSPEDRDLGTAYEEVAAEAAGEEEAEGEEEADENEDEDDSSGATLRTTFGGGFDNNPHNVGTAELPSEEFGGARGGSAFGTVILEAGFYGSPLPGFEFELDYALEQVAYAESGLADMAYQEHALELGLAKSLGDSARVLVTMGGELSLTGLGTGLVPFARALRAEGEVILGSGAVQLRVGGGYQTTEVYDRELRFLSGRRLEVRATPVLDAGGWRASLTARFRADALGVDRGEPMEIDLVLCELCIGSTLVPHSHRAVAAQLRLTAPWQWFARPGFWARAERRNYDDAMLEESAEGEASLGYSLLGERFSTTTALGANLRFRLTDAVSLTARYDYTRFEATFTESRSGVCIDLDDVCGVLPLAGTQYQIHTVGLQFEVDWL